MWWPHGGSLWFIKLLLQVQHTENIEYVILNRWGWAGAGGISLAISVRAHLGITVRSECNPASGVFSSSHRPFLVSRLNWLGPGTGLPPQELSPSKVACPLWTFRASLQSAVVAHRGFHCPTFLGVWMLVEHSSESESYWEPVRHTSASVLPLREQGFIWSQCLTLFSENYESKLVQSPLASAKSS